MLGTLVLLKLVECVRCCGMVEEEWNAHDNGILVLHASLVCELVFKQGKWEEGKGHGRSKWRRRAFSSHAQ
jgi:hypothetical protein